MLEKIKEILEYFQAWAKILAERLIWVFNWMDKTEETLSSLFPEETTTGA
jgi:hypothetical protein